MDAKAQKGKIDKNTEVFDPIRLRHCFLALCRVVQSRAQRTKDLFCRDIHSSNGFFKPIPIPTCYVVFAVEHGQVEVKVPMYVKNGKADVCTIHSKQVRTR